MEAKLLTLAIHTYEKANILKNLLESNNIEVYMEKIDNDDPDTPALTGYAVKINDSDLSRALSIMHAEQLFNYNDKDILKIDDNRRRILVAVDFSSYSMKACQVAFNIAKQINAKVKILHVFHNIYFPSHIPFADNLKDSPDEGLLSKVRKQILELCCDIDDKIANKECPSVNYSYSLREGVVEEEIENFVLEYKPSLLVLGTKGKDNNQNSVLGNVTADVIEMVDVPVLAVPESSSVKSISDMKRIAFLTNFQKRDLESFNTLVATSNHFQNVEITLMHINRINRQDDKWSEEQLGEMKKHFDRLYPQMNIKYKLIDSPDIPSAVSEYVEKENITVICLNTRRRNLLGRIFMPSISRKVLTNSEKAILVLRG